MVHLVKKWGKKRIVVSLLSNLLTESPSFLKIILEWYGSRCWIKKCVGSLWLRKCGDSTLWEVLFPLTLLLLVITRTSRSSNGRVCVLRVGKINYCFCDTKPLLSTFQQKPTDWQELRRCGDSTLWEVLFPLTWLLLVITRITQSSNGRVCVDDKGWIDVSKIEILLEGVNFVNLYLQW